ncbi:30S ribosomal protein S4 [Helcobacillus massiliensis]|uniref:Small ribosomal subunit protein uS4 n=1 Tax=Helcobacillus massiliensis TaxID=521392 RepID=A0A839QUD7_9MICO|nr:30S ribosomal protein S4 [Helcobacillus massiliensis]MCG7427319.1 30S ribosomal protein S4 [Helcobacillus sp. ACRRO]MBB3022469.1 small subunit ribosomal protein S4 [Helcobacillus massiliensis]MCT1557104.1 30S ribosomal protein S4 [Helcobacillus massiliensis]MCT2036161.1 30S ribosomal protein S4 [Helcobacillus massiliensis]MCT2331292.1 30S ribosomal protein S4 [Helcobacillus massiliensis]
MTSVTKARRTARLSRALGLALTPKAVKYFEKRPYPPGQHGRARRSNSDYAVRLTEKQRLRAQYQLREKQLHRAYVEAKKLPGLTGESMVELLEMRLDALVLRAGFARTILQARQAVTHRHVLVDGQLVDRPSFRVKPGQTIQIAPKAQTYETYQAAAEGGNSDVAASVPSYLSVELEELKAKLVSRPKRADVPVTCDVALVVEYYAR